MKVVVSYSGGMDSFTLLHKAIADGHEVHAMSFNYMQRHKRELDYAARVCGDLGVPHTIVDISFLHTIGNMSALTHGQPVPKGHYTDLSMKQTVVPNRNAILTSIAVAYAVNHELDDVWLGQHSGDHAIYPDCRPEFVALMDRVGQIANWHPVRVAAPFIDMDKEGILKLGRDMGLQASDYINTWTCYDPQYDGVACGQCGSCTERLEAFQAMRWIDPLDYAA